MIIVSVNLKQLKSNSNCLDSSIAGVPTLFHYACKSRDTYTRHRAEVIFLTDATCTYKVSIINIQGVPITICTVWGIFKLM